MTFNPGYRGTIISKYVFSVEVISFYWPRRDFVSRTKLVWLFFSFRIADRIFFFLLSWHFHEIRCFFIVMLIRDCFVGFHFKVFIFRFFVFWRGGSNEESIKIKIRNDNFDVMIGKDSGRKLISQKAFIFLWCLILGNNSNWKI